MSEFQASNAGTLLDEEGNAEDWLEIANATDTTVNLGGWHLTDQATLSTLWEFPTTNLGPGKFLVVFASGKDRRVPGRPLHTDFKLSASGEYLALVKPDGVTVATEFAPAFPPQAAGTSYGLPVTAHSVSLLAPGAWGKFQVPSDDAAGEDWTAPNFDDTAWTAVKTGVGFDDAGSLTPWMGSQIGETMHGVNGSAYLRIPFVVDQLADLEELTLRMRYNDGFLAYLNGRLAATRNAPVGTVGGTQADSVADWSATGAQGFKNWYYGIYEPAADPDGRYDPFTDFNHALAQWTWNGSAWVMGPANPPWDMIGSSTWQPNGDNSGGRHWVIRRWISTATGPATCRLAFAKDNTACGNGATLRVFQNGVPLLTAGIAYNDAIGIRTNLTLDSLQAGDRIDFALDPTGPDGAASDSCDSCTFAATIEQSPSPGPGWNSTALAARTANESGMAEEFSLTGIKDLLVAGTNVLALHGLNVSSDSPDFLLLPELIGIQRGMDSSRHVYFTQPTPGAANGPGATNMGPIVGEVGHLPVVPADGDDLTVTARITPTVGAIGAVTLKYRVMYGTEYSVPMYDDGQHGDNLAGDGIFAGAIPAAASKPGQMVRYYILASDAIDQKTRSPAFAEPKASPQYYGTVVYDPALTNSHLPVLHWFILSPAAADTDATARCSLFYDGEFYDNIGANIHGQSTRAFPKKSYDLDFNPGNKFRWSKDAPRVDDLNLLSTWGDKTHMRSVLAHETYRDAGSPCHFALPVRVQRNGAFFSVANLVENGDVNYLDRLGLDPNGALYKMYNPADSAGGAEKKSRKQEGTADLQALIAGMGQSTASSRQTYLYDNLNVPEIIDFLAAKIITADTDCCHKNYYLYRDSDGTGEWQMFPWDVDLSFGRVWTCNSPCLAYYDGTIYTNQSIFTGYGNTVVSPLFDTPATRQMFLRRLRTLMDKLMQPPGTPAVSDFYRLKTLALRDRIAPDAALDLAAWGNWGARETITQAVSRVWNEFLPARRAFLFNTMSAANGGEIPLPQPSNAVVQFHAFEYRSAAANPLQEWLSITNANSYAVDISDWRIEGGVRFTFKGGTVIPARSVVFVSPDVKSFRARTLFPKGGERRFVVGPYQGNLSSWGETLTLLDADGRVAATRTFTGDPSDAQRYLRITEIHYNPDPFPNSAGWDAQQFEFIEFRNTGTMPLDLAGVRLTQGVQFAFATGAITNLAAGARLILARNTNAFEFRYGAGLPVAGQYEGGLDNAGERLRLEDRFGEKILDFSYDNRWLPATDGNGFSLNIVDESLFWDAWGASTNWFAGASTAGAPAQPNQLPEIRLTSPVDGVSYLNPTNLLLSATAEDADGQVARIEFFADGVKLAESSGGVFSHVWTNPPPGLHSVGVVAVDDRLGIASSPAIRITVLSAPPTVRLTEPLHGTVLMAGSSLKLAAAAADADGQVDHVAYFSGAQLLGKSSTPPYSIAWTPTNTGCYALTAVATDTFGSSGTSAVVKVAFTTGSRGHYTLVPTNSIWRYLDDGSNQGTAWIQPAFSDGGWKSGPTELGYGDKGEGRPEATEISYGPSDANKFITTYFRLAFAVTNAAAFEDLTVSLLRDDGAVVYLNGQAVFQSNLAAGAGYLITASNAVSGANEAAFYSQSISPSNLREGKNVLAVEVHQSAPSSSDLSFDLSLTGIKSMLAPAILSQPASRKIQGGETVSFSVLAGGTAPLSYEWLFNGMRIPKADESVFVIANAGTSDIGNYQVRIVNGEGILLSDTATLSLFLTPPTAVADGLLAPQGNPVSVAASDLLANDINPGGGALTITGVISPSHSGATVALVDSRVHYQPAPDFLGNDWFFYQVADAYNQTAEGRVDVFVYSGALPAANQLTFDPIGTGYRLRYRGAPGLRCEIQRSQDLVRWTAVQEIGIPAYGVVEYVETNPPSSGAYYRVMLQ